MAKTKVGGRLEITKTRAGQWTWRKRSSNGQIVSGAWDSFKNKGHAIRQAKREYPSLADRCYVHSHGIFQV